MKTTLSIILFFFLQTLAFAQQRACDSTFKDTDGVTVHTCADREPEFPGGGEAYDNFIDKNMRYPAIAQKDHTSGWVKIQVIITEKGEIKSPKIVRSLKGKGSKECDAEALRLIGILPKWQPATIGGKPVRYIMTLRVMFAYEVEGEPFGLGSEIIVGDDDSPPPPPPPPFEGDNTPVQQEEEVSDTTVFKIVERMPQFPGGESELLKYLAKNITAPKGVDCAMGGNMIFSFIVEKDGSISHIEKLRGDESECATLAMDVLAKMPKWKPGLQNGKLVRVEYTIPIRFEPKR